MASSPSVHPVHLVLTVIGADRPGLVDRLSQLVAEHGGNWERSQMARLGGKFAGIVEVSITAGAAGALETTLDALGDAGLHVTVERTDPGPAVAGPRLVISLVGTDRPGLVHAVAGALADVGANIEELVTATTDAPMAGGTLFEATVTVALPDDVTADDVRTRLEAIADRLMVDIDVDVDRDIDRDIDRDVDPGTDPQGR